MTLEEAGSGGSSASPIALTSELLAARVDFVTVVPSAPRAATEPAPDLVGKAVEFLAEPGIEGFVGHLYLDSKWNPTIGIGLYVPSEAFFVRLTLHRERAVDDGGRDPVEDLAGTQEKRTEWSIFRKLKAKLKSNGTAPKAEFYLKNEPPRLWMSIDDAKRACRDHVVSVIRVLRRGYAHFDSWPEPAQLAVVDLAYNLGTDNLLATDCGPSNKRRNGKSCWPKLNAALRSDPPNWAIAVRESYRKDVGALRNERIAKLLEAAARVRTAPGPPQNVRAPQQLPESRPTAAPPP